MIYHLLTRASVEFIICPLSISSLLIAQWIISIAWEFRIDLGTSEPASGCSKAVFKVVKELPACAVCQEYVAHKIIERSIYIFWQVKQFSYIQESLPTELFCGQINFVYTCFTYKVFILFQQQHITCQPFLQLRISTLYYQVIRTQWMEPTLSTAAAKMI